MKSSRNFFFVLFVMVSAAIHAQKVGIRAGATISNVSGVSDTKPLTGIYLGVFKEITIVPEIFFYNQNYNILCKDINQETQRFRLDILIFPF